MHGAGGGGWEWTIWLRVFAARGLRVCAPDLMSAPAGLAATSFDDYRAQVVSWCRPESAQDLAPILLVGASLGGLLAMAVAAEVEARALLLVNPLLPAGLIGKDRGEAFPAIIPWGRERSLARTSRAMPDADDATRLFAWRHWRDESGLALGQQRSAANSPCATKPTIDACRTAAMSDPCSAGGPPTSPNGRRTG